MKKYALLSVLVFIALLTETKGQTLKDKYDDFKQQAHQEYSDFRKKCNAEYADFLKQAWQSYEAGPAIPQPIDEVVPPVVMPKEDLDKPIQPKPVPIDTVITPVIEQPTPQPLPVAPIYENTNPTNEYFTFTFFRTEGKVRLPKTKAQSLIALNNQLTGENLATAWEDLSNGEYDNLIRDCLELRIRHRLSDWAYMLMIRELSEKYYGGQCNAATFLMTWIYCQTGYQLRSAIDNGKLYMLFGTKHHIYDLPYFDIDGICFYPFLHKDEEFNGKVQICGASLPEEKPMSLYVPSAQSLAEHLSNPRTIQAEKYRSAVATVQVNQSLLDFYSTYPSSMIDDDFCTRWAMYANTPMADDIKAQLYPQIRKFIEGKSKVEAANIILHWVQTGFVYEYDDKVWGGDRAFFAEETLFYPYCDCEDRSILYTRIIRDILNLRCILIYYPGHLACAVEFTEAVNGDYIMLDNHKFIVTDPTYIGAPIGYTMPDMDNKTAKVILLK